MKQSLLFLITSLVLLPVTVFSQSAFQLNFPDEDQSSYMAKTVTGADQQRVYFDLDETIFEEGVLHIGSELEVFVEQGKSINFEIKRAENYTPTTQSYIAKDPQNPDRIFVFTYQNGTLTGMLHDSHTSTYFFEYSGDTHRNYVSSTSAYHDDLAACGLHEIEDETFLPVSADSRSKSQQGVTTHHTPNLQALSSVLESEITIDLLIAYTQKAENWARVVDDQGNVTRDIFSVIANSMALSQAALDNSDTYINLRLVHVYKTNYNDDGTSTTAGDHLRRFTQNPAQPRFDAEYDGYMEEVHGLRDQYGADLVALFADEPNTGGVAWLKSSVSGPQDLGFSVNRVQQMATSYTLVHEIGHNMGSSHARNQPSAAASATGGLFKYSVGNRFSTAQGNFATVMAYTTNGYSRIPYFSNPDIMYEGWPTGNLGGGDAGPADAARGFREAKYAIASYRNTTVDPPVLNVQDTGIDVEITEENQVITIPVSIQNNGESDLMWDVDFSLTSQGISLSKIAYEKALNLKDDFETSSTEPGSVFMESSESDIVYETTFATGSTFDTFQVGDHEINNGWRAFSSARAFEISDENPSVGNAHLRLPVRSSTNSWITARTPYFGPQPFGEFEITFDFAVTNIVAPSQQFNLTFYDSKTDGTSSGLVLFNGLIYTSAEDESGNKVYSNTGISHATNGSYMNARIKYSPENNTIDYFIDGQNIASHTYTSNPTPDYGRFSNANGDSDAFIDIDNLKVRKINSPYNWMSVNTFGGTTAPQGSSDLELSFTSEGVENGEYSTVLLLNSNDSEAGTIEIPINLTVSMATSTETGNPIPSEVSLSQNFPNPFNPSTVINYNLTQNSDVNLSVYNLLGQRVATLVNGPVAAGSHSERFDAGNLSSGVYIYKLQTAEQTLTRQMVLIK